MIRSRRTKPRPGRLQGKELESLRQDCYARDMGRCQECHILVNPLIDPYFDNSYHMAHIKAKRIGGDNLENVRTLCGACHRKSHNAGGKPVPKKVVL